MVDKIESTIEAWDRRELGCDEAHVETVEISEEIINESLALQMISIRLQKTLIEDLKMIGQLNGIGYQPLIRQVLKRFADSEKKQLLHEQASQQVMCSEDEPHPHLEKACG
jgi:predicted DNA binding CopG/RHH family protein